MQGFQDFTNRADALKGIFNSVTEADTAWKLALGRILRIGARPSQEGDIAEYEDMKAIIMNAKEYLDIFAI